MPVALHEAINGTSQVVTAFVGSAVNVVDLFLQPPLIFFTGIVVAGAAFALIRGFFRVKRR